MSDDSNQIPVDELETALDATSDWLITVYGARLAGIRLTLEGYYIGGRAFDGIVPLLARAEGETRATLPSAEVRDRAEAVFLALCPRARITRGLGDVRDVASSRRVAAAEVSAHRRLELLRRLGRPETTP